MTQQISLIIICCIRVMKCIPKCHFDKFIVYRRGSVLLSYTTCSLVKYYKVTKLANHSSRMCNINYCIFHPLIFAFICSSSRRLLISFDHCRSPAHSNFLWECIKYHDSSWLGRGEYHAFLVRTLIGWFSCFLIGSYRSVILYKREVSIWKNTTEFGGVQLTEVSVQRILFRLHCVE